MPRRAFSPASGQASFSGGHPGAAAPPRPQARPLAPPDAGASPGSGAGRRPGAAAGEETAGEKGRPPASFGVQAAPHSRPSRAERGLFLATWRSSISRGFAASSRSKCVTTQRPPWAPSISFPQPANRRAAIARTFPARFGWPDQGWETPGDWPKAAEQSSKPAIFVLLFWETSREVPPGGWHPSPVPVLCGPS